MQNKIRPTLLEEIPDTCLRQLRYSLDVQAHLKDYDVYVCCQYLCLETILRYVIVPAHSFILQSVFYTEMDFVSLGMAILGRALENSPAC